MNRIKVMTVFGTRPEAIKMAPVVRVLRESPAFEVKVAVTAQHREMLDQVLQHFGITPDDDLNIMLPRQSLTEVTTRALEGLEGVMARERPDLVLVHGDTTTTFAGSLAAYYQRLPVGHVEAGLRTFDKYSPYPEEMNRRLTGALTDLHFAPTAWARENLRREGIPEEKIFVTGNTAIDALLWTVRKNYSFSNPLLNRLDYSKCRVIAVEAHRRENWGQPMADIFSAVREIAQRHPQVEIVVSVHKNPEVSSVAHRLLAGEERIHLFEPFEYPEWANLLQRSYLILTDSGGLQEEAPSLGTPVLLLRETTERPEAIAAGTVRMIGARKDRIIAETETLLRDEAAYRAMSTATNPYGDGQSALRIRAAILFYFGQVEDRPADFALGKTSQKNYCGG